MAKKRLNPLEDPPKSSSSDDDDEVETEEQISDDSSSEEEDDLFSPVIIPPSKKPKTSAKVASGSKNPTAAAAAAAAVTVAIPSKPGSKRPREEISVHAKRSKKKEEDTKKPALFQRLWSEEDDLSLLQGMIDFNSELGKSPYEDMDGFYEFIKKSISFEATKNQTADKIRSLKKNYKKKVHKGVESIPKAHDLECFKLSDYIWESSGMALKSKSGKKSGKKSVKPQEKQVESQANVEVLDDDEKDEEEEDREVLVNGDKVQVDEQVLVNGDSKSPPPPGVVLRASDWFEDSFLVGSIASLGVGERFVKQKWSMVGVETKKKMEDKWKLLQAKEMELVLEKTDFMREVGSVIAEASS